MTTLVVEGLTVAYGDKPVVRDIWAVARPGRLLAVTGTSGAGKTTVLWAMAGLVRPRAGRITVDGVPLRGHDDAVSRGIVLIPQADGLAATLTAYENVQVALLAGGVPPREAARRAADSLELVNLSGQADQLVEEMSGGQRQRTVIARAVAMRGRVVLADEVTSELHAGSRRQVVDLLRSEARRGATVVFATHDLQAAAECDERLCLVDGTAEPQCD